MFEEDLRNLPFQYADLGDSQLVGSTGFHAACFFEPEEGD
jgi:hypothetical protein